MKSVLKINYHVDKLVLCYKIPESFIPHVESYDPFAQSFLSMDSNVFIFTRKIFATKYVIPIYMLEYRVTPTESILIGEFKPDIEQGITLTIDNRLLYSDYLSLIYKFEESFGLELIKIVQIDVACDANQNLPRKLNETMHKTNCNITRRGTKLPTTDKGNQILGTKVSQNIKAITCKERPNQSFYFELHTSGSRRPILYRAYDKGREIAERSHKDYITEKNAFGDSIYRFEVSVNSYELKKQSRNKSGFTVEDIYHNICNPDFLKQFFIRYINRLGTLTIDNRRFRISEILRLE